MTDHSAGANVEEGLHAFLAAELRRAERDYRPVEPRPALPPGRATPLGLLIAAAVIVGLLVWLRPPASPPADMGDGQALGSDGLPLSIDGQPVLRVEEIDARLEQAGADLYFVMGGRLIGGTSPCSVPSPTTPGGVSPCPIAWSIESASGADQSFPLVLMDDGPRPVPTSGALTVVRVAAAEDATRCGAICAGELVVAEILWRQPTRGPIPPEAHQGNEINPLLVPDFVAAWAQDGETIAGYIPKELLLSSDGVVEGTPENPPQEAPLPVYGEDLETLVGHMVPGEGFVPLDSP